MKSLLQYLNRRGAVNEATDSVSMQKASKSVMSLMDEYNSINESIMKSYVEAVQKFIKKGSSRNVDGLIQKWMKKHGKCSDSELTVKEYNELVDFVMLECWAVKPDGTAFVYSCRDFNVDKPSIDSLDRKFMQARMNVFKKTFG